MDGMYLMTVFVAVAGKLSFADAARTLDLSPAAVTRAINHLERKHGTRLLERSTRLVRLTDAGMAYLDHAKTIIALLKDADAAARGINIAPRGHLKVTAPVLFGKLFVMPGIADYLQRFPDMEVSALFLDRTVNLIDEGYDVAIRIGQLPDSGMKALRLGQVRRVLCASPAYLAKNGVPRQPGDLQGHCIIGTDVPAQQVNWRFGSTSSTTPVTVKLKPRLNVTSNDAAIEAAKLGFGIAQLPSYQIATQLAAGELKLVLDEHGGDPVPIHLLHRESKFAAARVRSFIDLLGQRLRADARVQ